MVALKSWYARPNFGTHGQKMGKKLGQIRYARVSTDHKKLDYSKAVICGVRYGYKVSLSSQTKFHSCGKATNGGPEKLVRTIFFFAIL